MNDSKIQYILNLANRDRAYQKMHERYVALEDAFDQLTETMTEKEKDVAWAYVLLGEEMSRYVLSIACRYIPDFPEAANT